MKDCYEIEINIFMCKIWRCVNPPTTDHATDHRPLTTDHRPICTDHRPPTSNIIYRPEFLKKI